MCSSGSVGSGVIDAFHSFMELFGGTDYPMFDLTFYNNFFWFVKFLVKINNKEKICKCIDGSI